MESLFAAGIFLGLCIGFAFGFIIMYFTSLGGGKNAN